MRRKDSGSCRAKTTDFAAYNALTSQDDSVALPIPVAGMAGVSPHDGMAAMAIDDSCLRVDSPNLSSIPPTTP
jgi:hypothetical protein